MRLSGNTILITGGASGIGLALASRFARAGSEVIICGRRKEQLERAKRDCPGLHTLTCDLASEAERKSLVESVLSDFPRLNVLINNAGIQNRPAPLRQPQDWSKHQQEISINLEAPMHLSMLFLPHLASHEPSAILNVTSGLAFAPIAAMPTYCATKAALHSFTMSLRYQLRDTKVRVIEIVPPAVNTDLGGKGLHTWGAPLDEFADHVMSKLEAGEEEFGYQSSETRRLASRAETDEFFLSLNKRFAAT